MRRFASVCAGAAVALLAACDGERAVLEDAGAGVPDASDLSDVSDLSDAGPADTGVPDGATLPDHAVYEDYPYKQEFHRNYTAEKGDLPSNDVRTLAVYNMGRVWAGTAAGVSYYEDGQWKESGLSEPVTDLMAEGESEVWAATPNALYRFDGNWAKIADVEGTTALASAGYAVWVAEANGIGVATSAGYELKLPLDRRANDLVETTANVLCVATNEGIFLFDSDLNSLSQITMSEGLPSDEVRSLTLGIVGDLETSDWLIAGTAKGLYSDGESGFGEPVDDVVAVFSRNQPFGTYYLLYASPQGAVRTLKDGEGWHYYHSKYWLPNDNVRDVLMTQTDEIFLASAGGIAHIWTEGTTLSDKAAHYDALNHERHVRLGYTTGNYLPVAGDTSAWSNGDDDNDGQWTGMYLGSQAFRYAVTGDPLALEYARTAMEAMLKLESITGAPGFFARSIVPGDQCEAKQGSGGEWHLSGDGVWCWKGDTSSDEFVGHMFGLSLYYDLVADEIEKERIAGTVGRILTRIIDNGYQLVDLDGLVTEHGQFDPYFMETIGIFGDAGLNSAMILGGLRAAYHMTGDQKYMDAFRDLIVKHKYHEYIKRAQEISQTAQINHDSDEMMFLAFFTLMRYEDDAKRRAWWLEGLEQLWQSQRPERNPEFNMIYAALTGTDGDLENSIDTLKRIHWVLVVWGCNNSHRKDIEIDKRRDRHGRIQSVDVLPYDERYVMKWNENPYNLDFEASGNSEESATYWLLPYWMGRFYGFISGPK